MKVEYYPKRDANYNVVRDTGYAVITPDAYNTAKKWPLFMAVHGMGERGGGLQKNLENLVNGFDWDNDGKIDSPGLVTTDMKTAVDKYGIVIVVPTYESNEFFEPAKVNWVLDDVNKRYSVVGKMMHSGFSLGGGCVIKYASSSDANAARVAYCVPCAATNALVSATTIAKANIPVHLYSNDNDNIVNVSSTKAIYNAITAANPTIKPLMTIFRRDGHGSNIEAWSLAPPKAPGGQGFTDAAENIYEVYLSILANGPRQMKAGAVTVPPLDPPPPTTKTAIVSYIQAGNVVILDGSKSTGYTSGLEGRWSLVTAPAGVTSDAVFPKGSNYITAGAVLPKSGAYSFRFTFDTLTKTVDIVSGKAPVKYDPATGLLTYSDGSTEKVTVVAVKTATGEVVNL